MGVSLNPATLLSGQGIDVTSLVNQIIETKNGQLSEWQNEQATLQTQATDITNINNDLNNLATAAQALSDPTGALSGAAVTSSLPSILTGSAQSSAAPGTYQVVVNSLASQTGVYSNELTNGNTSFLTDPTQTGEIDLQVGTTTTPITITAGSNDTLSTLASYINGQTGLGVTASVVTDATGSRLVLSSQSGSGVVAIGTNTNTSLTFTSVGGNASVTVNGGAPFTSTSNTVTGAIPGVTLNLLNAAPGTPVQLTVGANPDAAAQAINTFVSAYNTLLGDINTQYTVNPATNTEGPLGSDVALRSLQTSLLNDAAFAISGNSGYVNLTSLGITTNNDGTLSVVTASTDTQISLSDALAQNPAAFQNFFQDASGIGFANNLNNDLNNLTDPVSGVLNADLTQNTAQQQSLTSSINDFQSLLLAEQQQLTTEFDTVNASLQEYPLTLQAITETIASLDASSTSSGSSSSSLPTLTSGL